MNKPFKPPMINRSQASKPSTTIEPPAKKRRITPENDDDDIKIKATIAAANLLKKTPIHAHARKPLLTVNIPNGASQPSTSSEDVSRSYYAVLWRKFTMKKNKTWDGDGVLSVVGTSATLQDESGKQLGKGVCRGPLLPGSELSIGGKDVEIDSMIPREDYLSGRCFLGAVKKPSSDALHGENPKEQLTKKAQAKHNKLVATQKERIVPAVAMSKGGKAAFRAPLLNNTVQTSAKDAKVPVPRYDPKTEGALVMKRPKNVPRGKQLVDVVMDPLLSRVLREHQREGVAFMYECVMGMKDYDGEGAILADEMGLGKTLQTIALIWTLLKQNPIYEAGPVIKKALIVCPVTVINNWRKEFRKWLGNERIGVFLADNNKIRLTDFTKGKAYSVMIIGYEKLTKVQDQLQGDCGIDLVIADEGHRLKSAKNKAAAAIKSLNTERRIILSGTPVQNNLEEFYHMVDFVNPSIMSKYSTFKREFENPIVKSRQPGTSAKDIEKGEARAQELSDRTNMFILRRRKEILDKYLPPKTEYVVFCKPTKAQASVYRAIVGSQAFISAMNSQAVILELINVLKKVCNSPSLLVKKGDKSEEISKPELLQDVPQSLLRIPGGGKYQALDDLLLEIKQTGEKVVLVSNYTSTMDVLAQLLTSLGYSYLRLDGSTPQVKRQDLVDRFNRSPQSNSFVFLLSAKAGGLGLNLIGASRLILYDLDWNPSVDLQAMARVHRDGQKRPCFIYRMLTQGAIDEKIFQRQVSKTGLADSIVDGKANASGFSQAELRDLFTFDESDNCQTHQILGCTCGGTGTPNLEAAVEDGADSPRNDLASLSGEDGTEVIRLDGDDDAPPIRKITTTLRNQPALEAEFQRNMNESFDATGKAKMLSLMQYRHFDTALVGQEIDAEDEGGDVSALDVTDTAIDDDVLRSVLRKPGRRIGFVFTKLSSK